MSSENKEFNNEDNDKQKLFDDIIAYIFNSEIEEKKLASSYSSPESYYKKKANEGDTKAMIGLGMLCEDRKGDKEKNYMEAKEWYQKAYREENESALYRLAKLQIKGIKEKEDEKDEHYTQDQIEGFRNLGTCYYEGLVVKRSYRRAKMCFEVAANYEEEVAMLSLGGLYESGEGGEMSYTKALYWYKKAAELHCNQRAMYFIGNIYANGELEEYHDMIQALYWYEKSAEHKEPLAMYALGELFEQGKGCKRDYEQAYEWYFKALEYGDARAEYKLGILYEEGKGTEQDDTMARSHYLNIRKLDLDKKIKGDVEYRLGNFFKHGRGEVRSYRQALDAYSKARVFGNKKAVVAKANLTFKHSKDNYELTMALAALRNEADKGNEFAMFRLGKIYHMGILEKQDLYKAKEYYEQAAKRGNDNAMVNLAALYFEGNGVKKIYY